MYQNLNSYDYEKIQLNLCLKCLSGALLEISIHGCHGCHKVCGCHWPCLFSKTQNFAGAKIYISKFCGCQAPVAPVLTRLLCLLDLPDLLANHSAENLRCFASISCNWPSVLLFKSEFRLFFLRKELHGGDDPSFCWFHDSLSPEKNIFFILLY